MLAEFGEQHSKCTYSKHYPTHTCLACSRGCYEETAPVEFMLYPGETGLAVYLLDYLYLF